MPSITQVTRKYLEVNELGRRINSSHPNCSVSQEIVDSIRLLRETLGLSYSRINNLFFTEGNLWEVLPLRD